MRDAWEVLDAGDNLVTHLREDSTAMGMVRRVVPMGNMVPQKFHLGDDRNIYAEFSTHFNPFVLKMTVKVHVGCPVDPALVLAGGILLVAIEGRQDG